MILNELIVDHELDAEVVIIASVFLVAIQNLLVGVGKNVVEAESSITASLPLPLRHCRLSHNEPGGGPGLAPAVCWLGRTPQPWPHPGYGIYLTYLRNAHAVQGRVTEAAHIDVLAMEVEGSMLFDLLVGYVLNFREAVVVVRLALQIVVHDYKARNHVVNG
ncbi:hypothetical protein PG994_003926 [Apiospora phragmitis]|uniref:Uncharacterized protein n=1 Tax=Apiospora phragmitis TaxID=2905665 RepID=A0ABR1W3B2_9PEZI